MRRGDFRLKRRPVKYHVSRSDYSIQLQATEPPAAAGFAHIARVGLAATVCIMIFCGCSLYRNTFGGLNQDFWSKTAAHRCSAIADYSLSKQLDLYLQGRTEKNPPDPYIVEGVAANGLNIVPLTVQRLRQDPSDRDRLAMLYLLEVISAEHFDLSNDAGLLENLQRQASSIKDASEREQAEQTVRKIAVRRYPLPEQLYMYLNGDGAGQPDFVLVRPVATNGAAIVPLVLGEMHKQQSDLVRLDLLYLLMHVSPRYDNLTQNRSVIRRLRQIASTMRDPYWRRTAEDYIGKIQAGVTLEPTPPCKAVSLSLPDYLPSDQWRNVPAFDQTTYPPQL
jgi:hypothetical protein